MSVAAVVSDAGSSMAKPVVCPVQNVAALSRRRHLDYHDAMRKSASIADTSTRCGSDPAGFRVGDWIVHPGLNRIERSGEIRTLEPRSMDVLMFLAQRAGTTCSREQILDGVWGTRCVVDGVVTKIVSELRRALDDDAQVPSYLQTVSRRGYRLIAAVDVITNAVASDMAGTGREWSWRRIAMAAAIVLFAVMATALLTHRMRGAMPSAMVRSIEPVIGAIGIHAFDPIGGHDHDYLAHGISEQMAVALAQSGRVRVYGPAAMRGRDPYRADASLDAVLAGSLWQHEGRLRLNAHLTELRSGRMLWARQLDFAPADTFAVVADLVGEVARIADRHVDPTRLRIDDRGSRLSEAYLAYLRARQLWRERDREDLARARDLLTEAIAIDPDFALAHAGLADTYLALVNYRVLPREEGFALAEAAARRALALEANLPEANRSAGWVRLNAYWDFAGARALFERAIALDPGDASAHQLLAECLSILGEHAAASAMIAQAVDLEPSSPLMRAVAGLIAYADGRYLEALDRFDQADRLGPKFSWLHRYRADALVRLRRIDAAIAARLALARAEGVEATALHELDAAVATRQLAGYWRWQLAYLERQRDAGRPVEIALLAEAYAANDRVDPALALIERILAERGEYFLLIRRSPAFDILAARADYRRLLTQAGLHVETPVTDLALAAGSEALHRVDH